MDYFWQQPLHMLALAREQNQNIGQLTVLLHNRRRRRRRFWVRPWISRRHLHGANEQLMIELQREAHGDFTGFIRMDPVMFHELLVRLTPRLTKQDTHMRRALEPGLKLAVTLRFLATGNSYRSLAFTFRVPHNTISIFVREVCAAIVDEFGEEVVALPTTEPGWRGISEQFSTRWNFHHTLGAIDGKHIAIKCPPNSGSVFHNYKKFFSVILLGIVDADYRFLWVNMGANGSTSDCAVASYATPNPFLWNKICF
jgi:hypothetical protein